MPELKLAANMRCLREIYDYTQEYVGSQSNSARQTYSNYERGEVLPPLSAVIALSELYHVSVDQLLFGDFSRVHTADDIIREHAAITPENSLIRLDGPSAKMVMDYKKFPAEGQREVRDFVRFKKHLYSREVQS